MNAFRETTYSIAVGCYLFLMFICAIFLVVAVCNSDWKGGIFMFFLSLCSYLLAAWTAKQQDNV